MLCYYAVCISKLCLGFNDEISMYYFSKECLLNQEANNYMGSTREGKNIQDSGHGHVSRPTHRCMVLGPQSGPTFETRTVSLRGPTVSTIRVVT